MLVACKRAVTLQAEKMADPRWAAPQMKLLSVAQDSFGITNLIPRTLISLIWGSSDNT